MRRKVEWNRTRPRRHAIVTTQLKANQTAQRMNVAVGLAVGLAERIVLAVAFAFAQAVSRASSILSKR
ncbi:MAG TPA: hypothetical protein VJP81_07460 [Candidatus Dormibacteraeota bacterium]|nr:hypothetical protein [Candidatus Dormibacteraeota bacterium]